MKYAVIYNANSIYDVKAVCVFTNTAEREKGMFTARMKYLREHKLMDNLKTVMSTLIEEVTAKEAYKLIKSNIEVIDCTRENSLDHSKPIYCLYSHRSDKLIATSNSIRYIINKVQEYERPNLWIAVIDNKKAYNLLDIEGRFLTVYYEGLPKVNMDKIDLCKRVMPFPYCSLSVRTQDKNSITYEADRW